MVFNGRSLLIYVLSAALAVPQAFAAPATAAAVALPAELPVTIESTLAANANYANPEISLARLTPGVAPEDRAAHLESTRKGMLSTGGKIVNEVIGFQAMVILLATLSFQASREHKELLNLSNGQLPEPKSEGECQGTGTFSALLCSGEFWVGSVGAAGFLAVNSVAGAVFNTLMKNGAGRLSVFRYLSSMASSAFMMFGATASSFLWTEAVKALPNPKMIHQATGVAGRALQAKLTLNWPAFKASADGQIFSAILNNMWNILWADSQMRNQWVYNTWRFGIARGEFITAVGVIMGASTAGETIALVAAGAIGIAWTGPLIGFVVCLALGFGAMTLLFKADAPRLLTKAMQGMRSVTSQAFMRRSRGNIQLLMNSGFNMYRYPQANDPAYINTYDTYLASTIESVQSARENYANVVVEKYYETLMQQRALETKIEIAETAVRNVYLQKNLFVEVDNKIISFEEAKQKLCEKRQNCEGTIGKQLDVLKKLRPAIAESKQLLTESVKSLSEQYAYDAKIADDIAKSPDVLLPAEPIATRLHEFGRRSKALRKEVLITLAGSEKDVARNIGFEVTPEQVEEFRVHLGVFYTQSFIEAKIYDEQKKTATGILE